MRRILLCTLLSCSALSFFGQNRTTHPFQVQVNLSGAIFRSAGNILTRENVANVEVRQWELPGVSVGYHLSKSLYLGYAFHPNRRFIFNDEYSFNGNGVNDVLIDVDSNTGNQHSLNARFSPFTAGLYGAFFINHTTEAQYELTGKPIGETFEIAGEAYTEAFDIQWDFKDRTGFGIGLGWNQVFSNGTSFDIGAGLPIDFVKTVHENVEVIREDNAFDLDDVERIQEVIEEEDFYFPLHIYLSLGKNF